MKIIENIIKVTKDYEGTIFINGNAVCEHKSFDANTFIDEERANAFAKDDSCSENILRDNFFNNLREEEIDVDDAQLFPTITKISVQDYLNEVGENDDALLTSFSFNGIWYEVKEMKYEIVGVYDKEGNHIKSTKKVLVEKELEVK